MMSSCDTASCNEPHSNRSGACCVAEDTAICSVDSRFSCYICFEEVTEPVVTRCGHLYCWPCLFQWLEPGMRREERASLGLIPSAFCDESRRVCPVCKSECPLPSIVPVYVRSRLTASAPASKHSNLGNETNNSNDNNGEGQQRRTGTDDPDDIGSGAHEPETDTNTNENENENTNAVDCNNTAVEGGLRRRQIANRSAEHTLGSNVLVPNRPSVSHVSQQPAELPEPSSPSLSNRSSPGSSPRTSASNSYPMGGLAPRSPNGHNASLTHGILSSLQRATADYYRNNNSGSDDDEPDRRRLIPSLHDLNLNGWGDREGLHDHSGAGTTVDVNSETTQYLSRLLIMLTSFVIFCFLLV